jgi:hypothetical protein
MSSDDTHYAATRRDQGVRTVSKFTWRAGVAGLICSGIIGLAFGHHADSQTAQPGQQGIVVPNQPPAPVQGGGAPQVTSGAS